MSAAGWMAFSIICFTLAGLFLALSVLLFIRYKIPRVIGDLSGRQAAKEVAALRGDSEAQKTARAHSGHTSDFKAMAMAHENKRLDLIDDEGAGPTEDFGMSGKAELLSPPKTGVLNEKPEAAIGITQVLNETGGPVVFEPGEEIRSTEDLRTISHFVITKSVTVIHTEEYV
ncbi:MAG: hypothetical protein K6F11_01890 [Lachnospiraceae bacterium]|jgi:hypothetical protein|nr:hypothetical protein [Lachnospiraceae bacterium]